MSEMHSTPPAARRLCARDGVVFKELDGESVLLDLASGTYFGLNDTGTCLWQGLTESNDLDVAVCRLVAHFDVDPAVARADALRLIAALVDRRLLVDAEDLPSR